MYMRRSRIREERAADGTGGTGDIAGSGGTADPEGAGRDRSEDTAELRTTPPAGTVPPQRGPDDTEQHLAEASSQTSPSQAPDTSSSPPSPPGTRRSRRARPPKKRWPRILAWTAGSLAFVIAAVAVAGWLYIRHLDGNLTKEDLYLGEGEMEGSQPNAAGQTPINILLLGTDSRDGAANQDLGGAVDLAGGPQRADTQILLHVAADRSNATLISIPRDTQVTIPTCIDSDTGEEYPEMESESINLSLSHGGPGCTVATWHELTDIPIDHFMMVDFAGVVEMADAVGGVPVCVEDNVRDPDSGLELTAGDHVVEGEQALQWLRTRHGFEDGSDIGRTKAQQMYLSNMVTQLQNGTSLTDPGQLMNLAEAATNALTVDHGLGGVTRLYDLGEDLRQVPSDRINMVTMPWLRDPENPEVTVIPDPVKAEQLFSLVREDIPIDEQGADEGAGEGGGQESGPDGGQESGGAGDPGGAEEPTPEATADPAEQIAVAVRNGTGYDGAAPVDSRASVITDELHRMGFASAFTDVTPAAEATTTVLYPENTGDDTARANAEAVATALGLPGSAVRASDTVLQPTLVIGADWLDGTSYPEQEDGGGEGSGGGGGGGSPVDPDDIISGDSSEKCMAVNPFYTW
ncbi:LCP family protein [Streptomyces sp. 4N509B]|uniref:LCP family protein n=1 Tax=Streptomyces sp. 4N509B TaxID=3457413 RepID=UPI003FCF8415